MRKLLTLIVTILFTITTFSQELGKDYYQKEQYNQYLMDQYKYEKNKLMWGLVGGLAFGASGILNYYIQGNRQQLMLTSGLSLSFNIYSVSRLIHLKRELNKLSGT